MGSTEKGDGVKIRSALSVISLFVLSMVVLTLFSAESATPSAYHQAIHKAAPVAPTQRDTVPIAQVASGHRMQAADAWLAAQSAAIQAQQAAQAAQAAAAAKAQAAAQAAAAPVQPVSSGNSTWACIIAHESGGNPTVVNSSSGAGGLFQFLPSSWIGYGGGQYASLPEYATVAQQWAVAIHAQAVSGWSPWRGDGCVG